MRDWAELILIPACASSSPAFLMIYSAYKLNKQGDNMQPWCTPFPIGKQSVVPCTVLTVASWPAYRFLRRQVRWSGMPISNFPHSQRLWHSQQSRSRCFSGTLLLFQWSNRCWQFDLWFLWKRSVFIPIPKKGNAKECSDYCTIALISHTSKVKTLKILQARLH